jgi:phosphatidylinositol-bisphosphatase
MDLLQKENLLALRKKDQLNIERSLGNVFVGFEEAPLTFPPTYKYQPNTDIYEVRPEKKLRPPAWCDRILWKDNTIPRRDDQTETNSAKSSSIQIKNYRMSHLRPSDHKPVSAAFAIETRVIEAEKEKAEYMRLVRELDRMENEVQPKVEVGPLLDLQFQKVRFQVSVCCHLFSRSVGEKACSFLHYQCWIFNS